MPLSDKPAHRQMPVSDALHLAVEHHQAGRLAEAENLYGQILAVEARHPDALHLAGVVAMQTGRNDLAIERIANAIKVRPEFTEAYNNLGNALKNLGRLRDAVLSYQKAIELNPKLAEAHYNLAGTFQGLGDPKGALVAYKEALAIRPDYLQALINIGNTYRDLGDYDAAIKAYDRAITIEPNSAGRIYAEYAQLFNMQGAYEQAVLWSDKALSCDPGDVEALNCKGLALSEIGRASEAIRWFENAVSLAPAHAIAHNNMGNTWRILRHYPKALNCFEKAVALDPKSADFLCNMGIVLSDLGRPDEAVATFQAALEIDLEAGNAWVQMASVKSRQGKIEDAILGMDKALLLEPERAGWGVRSALLLPVIAQSRDDFLKYRDRMSRTIAEMDGRSLSLADPYVDIGMTNFRMSYDEISNREMAQRISSFYLSLCPDLGFVADHCLQKPISRKARLKIGFVSAHLRSHTIGKLNAGIIKGFSSDRFEVVIVRAPGGDDAFAAQIDETAASVMNLAGQLMADRRAISEQHFDVLFYLDIGLEPYTYFLSFARLAPVQAVTWGHPDTTGVPNLDYFVSSNLMEPENADDHYSETLVLLNHMPTVYQLPLRPHEAISRRDFGLPENVNLYVCPQTLFKFHPDFDSTLRKMLRNDQNGRLVLIADPSPEPWRELLSERLQETLGENFEQVVFVPFMSEPKYLGLLSISDVIIDIPMFSGGNSTLEAFAMGTPVVTWPGKFMRGRVTAGYYRQMKMDDLIATSEDEYLEQAKRLATDPDYRREMTEKIGNNRAKLFEEIAVVHEMETFFEGAYETWRVT